MKKKMKLPRATTRHPLVVGIERVMAERAISMRQIAIEHLGVRQQSLHEWVEAARRDRDFEVPPRRVPAICKLTGQAPYLYNPVLWPSPDWRF